MENKPHIDKQVKMLIDNSNALYDDFISILPENYNPLELIFCVQTIITYCFWNKLVTDEIVLQTYSSKDMMERQLNWSSDLITKYVSPDMMEKGNARTGEYRSALQPGSENTFLLSGLIYKSDRKKKI